MNVQENEGENNAPTKKEKEKETKEIESKGDKGVTEQLEKLTVTQE